MTFETQQLDVDPLDAIRAQLLEAARGRSHQRDRRRKRRLILAGILSTLAVAASTAVAAVSDFSTGVPVIDKLLKVDGPSMGNDVGPGGATQPIEISTGSSTLSLVAYATPSNKVCVAQGVARAASSGPEGGLGGCESSASLAEDVDREGIVWTTVTLIGDYRLFLGYAAASVADVRVRDSQLQTTVRLSPPWALPGVEGRAIRLLAVYDRAPAIARSNDDPADDDLRQLVTRNPRVEALDESGQPIARWGNASK